MNRKKVRRSGQIQSSNVPVDQVNHRPAPVETTQTNTNLQSAGEGSSKSTMDQQNASNKLRRSVRIQRYKHLIEKASAVSRQVESLDPADILQALDAIVTEANSTLGEEDRNGRAEDASVLNIDAQIIKMAHDILGQVVSNARSNQFVDEDLIGAVLLTVKSQT